MKPRTCETCAKRKRKYFEFEWWVKEKYGTCPSWQPRRHTWILWLIVLIVAIAGLALCVISAIKDQARIDAIKLPVKKLYAYFHYEYIENHQFHVVYITAYTDGWRNNIEILDIPTEIMRADGHAEPWAWIRYPEQINVRDK